MDARPLSVRGVAHWDGGRRDRTVIGCTFAVSELNRRVLRQLGDGLVYYGRQPRCHCPVVNGSQTFCLRLRARATSAEGAKTAMKKTVLY